MKATLISTAEGFQIQCRCGKDVAGIYFTQKKGQKAVDAHNQMNHSEFSLEAAKSRVEEIAKKSKTFVQFQNSCLADGTLKTMAPSRIIHQLIQENETAMNLD